MILYAHKLVSKRVRLLAFRANSYSKVFRITLEICLLNKEISKNSSAIYFSDKNSDQKIFLRFRWLLQHMDFVRSYFFTNATLTSRKLFSSKLDWGLSANLILMTKVFNCSELHSQRSNFLQNPYFRVCTCNTNAHVNLHPDT